MLNDKTANVLSAVGVFLFVLYIVSILAMDGYPQIQIRPAFLSSVLVWWPTPIAVLLASFSSFGASSLYHLWSLRLGRRRTLVNTIIGWVSLTFALILLVPMSFIPKYLADL